MLLEEVGGYFFPTDCLDPGLHEPCPPAKPSCQQPQPGRVPAGLWGPSPVTLFPQSQPSKVSPSPRRSSANDK